MIEGMNFIKFKLAFEVFKREQESWLNPNVNENFIHHIDNRLQELETNTNYAKIFELTDKQKDFFVKGKVKVNKKMNIKLPFPTMFLDVSFTKEELAEYGINVKAEELIGLIIAKGYVYKTEDDKEVKEKHTDIPEKSVGEVIRFSVCLRYIDDEGKEAIQFETFFRNVVFNDERYDEKNIAKEKYLDNKAQDFWYKFSLNLIRFINFPEIKLKEHKKSEKNIERKRRKGRIVIIPELITVELTGVMQKYIDDVYEKPKTSWHYNYCFDVKGHYRHLVSQRYKEPKTIWVEHFTKGTGKKVPSLYKIKRRK